MGYRGFYWAATQTEDNVSWPGTKFASPTSMAAWSQESEDVGVVIEGAMGMSQTNRSEQTLAGLANDQGL
jgi:hypothetical protein